MGQQLTCRNIQHGVVPDFDVITGPGHRSSLGLGLALGSVFIRNLHPGSGLRPSPDAGPSLYFNWSENLDLPPL